MPEPSDTLVRCFVSVFPSLTAEEARVASMTSIEGWDSLATVTLTALVEQEFGIRVDLSDLSALNSFIAFRAYIDHRCGTRPGKELHKNS